MEIMSAELVKDGEFTRHIFLDTEVGLIQSSVKNLTDVLSDDELIVRRTSLFEPKGVHLEIAHNNEIGPKGFSLMRDNLTRLKLQERKGNYFVVRDELLGEAFSRWNGGRAYVSPQSFRSIDLEEYLGSYREFAAEHFVTLGYDLPPGTLLPDIRLEWLIEPSNKKLSGPDLRLTNLVGMKDGITTWRWSMSNFERKGIN